MTQLFLYKTFIDKLQWNTVQHVLPTQILSYTIGCDSLLIYASEGAIN